MSFALPKKSLVVAVTVAAGPTSIPRDQLVTMLFRSVRFETVTIPVFSPLPSTVQFAIVVALDSPIEIESREPSCSKKLVFVSRVGVASTKTPSPWPVGYP